MEAGDGARAGAFVQTIDVLRDDGRRCFLSSPFGEDRVRAVRLRIANEAAPPVVPFPDQFWIVGEGLDPSILESATRAAAGCDVFLAVGTSAVVYPAAGLVPHARRSGATVIEINPETTDASGIADIAVRMPADEALAAIDAML